MSTWAQRAKAHFQQERQNSTTETTETPCVFTEVRPKHTTETTETPLSMVLTVHSGRFREKHDFQRQAESAAANDPAPTPTKVQALPWADSASGAAIDIGTIRPPGLSSALLVASQALDAQIHAVGLLPGNDPDRWCYPDSEAMTGTELDLFTARLARFIDKGVSHADAESLADKLVIRDRESDSRRLCLECTHLSGYGRTSWRCGNWRRAGVARQARDDQLPADLVLQLQRCAGLTHAFNPTTKVS